jgi:predicted house-cleaning noncanonical NTP pyrophosphatase (MazG superfamily)
MVAKDAEAAELEQLPNNVLRPYLKDQDFEELADLVESYSGLRLTVYDDQARATATKSQLVSYLMETMNE